jgi:hypothetical protein
MKTLFEIIDFIAERNLNSLTVELENTTCEIPLSKFEDWLQRTDRLNWVHDWSDHTGEHCQESGTYTLDQYWDMSHKYIAHDIYTYILINFVDPFKDIKNSITKITAEYAGN